MKQTPGMSVHACVPAIGNKQLEYRIVLICTLSVPPTPSVPASISTTRQIAPAQLDLNDSVLQDLNKLTVSEKEKDAVRACQNLHLLLTQRALLSAANRDA